MKKLQPQQRATRHRPSHQTHTCSAYTYSKRRRRQKDDGDDHDHGDGDPPPQQSTATSAPASLKCLTSSCAARCETPHKYVPGQRRPAGTALPSARPMHPSGTFRKHNGHKRSKVGQVRFVSIEADLPAVDRQGKPNNPGSDQTITQRATQRTLCSLSRHATSFALPSMSAGSPRFFSSTRTQSVTRGKSCRWGVWGQGQEGSMR